MWIGWRRAGSHTVSVLRHLQSGYSGRSVPQHSQAPTSEKAMISSFASPYAVSSGVPFLPSGSLGAGRWSASPALLLPLHSLPILQPATCASLPSARTCARPSMLSAATRTCWRAPCPRSCRPSTWPPGCPCPTPGSAPTHWQEKRSELSPRPHHNVMATVPQPSPRVAPVLYQGPVASLASGPPNLSHLLLILGPAGLSSFSP